MHGFPDWLFWPLDLLSWCLTHWGWVAAALALAGACIVWRRQVLVALLSGVWLAWELARPLTRPLRTWWARVCFDHRFEFWRSIYGDEINAWGGKRSIWRCARCGKLQARDELHQDGSGPK